ncbi:MAG: DUF4278 domain-containing protein [Cyanobacteria bacterium P01_A01_bin.40]
MKLQFRGNFYETPQTKWNVTEGDVGGMYRGKPWKVHYLQEQHRHKHAQSELTYRGIHYTKK